MEIYPHINPIEQENRDLKHQLELQKKNNEIHKKEIENQKKELEMLKLQLYLAKKGIVIPSNL